RRAGRAAPAPPEHRSRRRRCLDLYNRTSPVLHPRRAVSALRANHRTPRARASHFEVTVAGAQTLNPPSRASRCHRYILIQARNRRTRRKDWHASRTLPRLAKAAAPAPNPGRSQQLVVEHFRSVKELEGHRIVDARVNEVAPVLK